MMGRRSQKAVEPATSIDQMAQALATTLAKELQLSYELISKATDIQVLEAKPPEREKLRFSIKDGQPAPKTHSKAQNPEQYINDEYLCTIEGRYLKTSYVDIDHVTAYSILIERQQAFLDFINHTPNKILAEAFLKIQNPPIHHFFKKDSQDGKIKGTLYFYKACYNAEENLMLLGHGPNMKKSDTDVMVWAKAEKLPFVGAIEKQGGKKRGLLIDVVTESPTTGLIATLDLAGVPCKIHTGTGLGKFIREWTSQTQKNSMTLHHRFQGEIFYALMKKLKIAESYQLSGDNDKAKQIYKHAERSLTTSIVAMNREPEQHSEESGSDTEVDKKGHQEAEENNQRVSETKEHFIKLLREQMQSKFRDKKTEIREAITQLYGAQHNFAIEQIKALHNTIKASTELWEEVQQSITVFLNLGTQSQQLEAKDVQLRDAEKQIVATQQAKETAILRAHTAEQWFNAAEQAKEAETRRADIEKRGRNSTSQYG